MREDLLLLIEPKRLNLFVEFISILEPILTIRRRERSFVGESQSSIDSDPTHDFRVEAVERERSAVERGKEKIELTSSVVRLEPPRSIDRCDGNEMSVSDRSETPETRKN